MLIASQNIHNVVKIIQRTTHFEGSTPFDSTSFRFEMDDGGVIEISALSYVPIVVEIEPSKTVGMPV